MSFVLALVALILAVVFWATHALSVELAGLFALLALAVMLASYGDVAGLLPRRQQQ